jgi:simple sugar transport system substrate-binding protein
MRRVLLVLCVVLSLGAAPALAAEKPLVFGLLLVGPQNDKGYSQAQYEGGQYVEAKLPGAKMLCLDKINPTDRPGVTIPQIVDDMVAKGATLILAGSDDMRDGIREAAQAHPAVTFVHVSGDEALTGKAPKNLGNLFAKMEYTNMMAGFAAGMATATGKIGFLGPLINDETVRLANAAYLGARYAWETVRGEKPAALTFKVLWIGFWFNIPGVTADPNQVAGSFFDQHFDVVVSGLDTPEALTVAEARRKAGAKVFAVPYNYKQACQGAEDACLGVPYFNWGPPFLSVATAVVNGTYKPGFTWLAPEYATLNDPEGSPVGFLEGGALSPQARQALARYVADLASGKLDPYAGPLEFMDGTTFVAAGKTPTDKELWFCSKLLRGMEGVSAAGK